MAEYILEAQNLIYKYSDGTCALDGISVKIEKGKKIAVLGPNGAGKSTFLMHLNGVLKPSEGRLFFKGNQFGYTRTALTELRKSVGMVFQDPDTQLFSASVFQEISFGPMNLRLPVDEVKRRVENALNNSGILELKYKPTHFLSYGQKKRVCIAGVLAMEPEVIILDEPFEGLDPQHAIQMMELFDSMNNKGITLVISTHNVDTAYLWADYVLVMVKGKLVKEGMPEDIFTDSSLLQSAGLVKPFIVEVYEKLKESGHIDSKTPLPRSKAQLFEILQNGIK